MRIYQLYINAFLVLALFGCRPKPINIDIPQTKQSITISSLAYNERTVFVSIGYSVNSMLSIEDTTASQMRLPDEMRIDSALVLINSASGIDTLAPIRSGLYASRTMNLHNGEQYTLTVKDLKKNITVSATNTFLPQATVASIKHQLQKTNTDTTLKLEVALNDVTADKRYLLSYCTTKQLREASKPPTKKLSAAHSFEAKRLELISGADANGTSFKKSFTIKACIGDTLMVHIARIDDGYYKYLAAYKKTGYLINQLTGEPINLPTNVFTGFGYFSLYMPNHTTIYVADETR